VHQPRQTAPPGAADATAREALTAEVCNPGALRSRKEAVFGHGHQLAFARVTPMMLRTMVGMAILLVPA
jgi:hypothetical protein